MNRTYFANFAVKNCKTRTAKNAKVAKDKPAAWTDHKKQQKAGPLVGGRRLGYNNWFKDGREARPSTSHYFLWEKLNKSNRSSIAGLFVGT